MRITKGYSTIKHCPFIRFSCFEWAITKYLCNDNPETAVCFVDSKGLFNRFFCNNLQEALQTYHDYK